MNTKFLMHELFESGISAVNPRNVIKNKCRFERNIFSVEDDNDPLWEYKNIYVVGSGKAAYTMAKAIEAMLGNHITSGVVVAPECKGELKQIRCLVSDHPLPSERSVDAAQDVIRTMQSFSADDLFIYLLSGGTSALIEAPVEGVSLDEMKVTTDLMLKGGLKIDEMNVIRKHLSLIKGGRLAAQTEATGIVLTMSDVIGDDLYSIGSAPLYADTSTYDDAKSILEKYALFDKVPKSVQKAIKEGCEGKREETLKIPASHIKHYLIGTNALAKQAVYEKALSKNFSAKIYETLLDMDVEDATQKMLDIATQLEENVIIFGGEVTVNVTGEGKGGRNQHMVLSMLERMIQSSTMFSFLSGGTDGIDGNSIAAGAYIDMTSASRAESLGLSIQEYQLKNDSYHFFEALNDVIVTGPTGTNVMDIAILIKE